MKKNPVLRTPNDKDQDWAAVMKTPFGKVGIKTRMFDHSLMIEEIFYVSTNTPLKAPKNVLAKEAVQQIEHYLLDPAFSFDLPLIPFGTEHQNKVWKKISKIPLGQAISYGAIAKDIKSAPRAVGQACGSNPYPIVIPCHRVVSSTGIGGFARHDEEGYHRNIKTWLLHHEGYLSND
jgi:methylated-DNA-[protein]-cysteine S-methyltransferase